MCRKYRHIHHPGVPKGCHLGTKHHSFGTVGLVFHIAVVGFKLAATSMFSNQGGILPTYVTDQQRNPQALGA